MSQLQVSCSSLSVLLVIENSAKVAKDWLNLRDRYIRNTIDRLKASNTSLPTSIMVLPSSPLHNNNDPPSCYLPQYYGDLQDFEFNLHPGNRLSAGHIHCGIQYLSSCQTAQHSLAEKHIFIVAATTPSESISGVDCAGKPVWSFLAQKLVETNIYCHLIVSSADDVAPLSRLYEETLHLQGHIEHSFHITPWFGSSAPYTLRLAMQPPTPGVSSPAISTPEPRVLSAPFTHAITKSIVARSSAETDGAQEFARRFQPNRSVAQKKANSLRSVMKDEQIPLTPVKMQGGRATPYKLERGSRVGGSPHPTSNSRISGTACHISTLTPGVTTLLPIPPAPVKPSMTKAQTRTILPIPPAPSSTPVPVITQTLLPVPPAPRSTPSSPLTERLRLQNLYTKEFVASSAAGMSAVLPVPPPPTPKCTPPMTADQRPKRQTQSNGHITPLEDEEMIIDAFLDPANHHYTLDFFQKNLMPMLDVGSGGVQAILKDSMNNGKTMDGISHGDDRTSGHAMFPERPVREYTDSYPVAEYDAAMTFSPSPRSCTSDLIVYDEEARSGRLLPTLGSYVAPPPSPSSSALTSPVENTSNQGTSKISVESLSSLQGWAG